MDLSTEPRRPGKGDQVAGTAHAKALWQDSHGEHEGLEGRVHDRRWGWGSHMIWALGDHIWGFAFLLRGPGHLGGSSRWMM